VSLPVLTLKHRCHMASSKATCNARVIARQANTGKKAAEAAKNAADTAFDMMSYYALLAARAGSGEDIMPASKFEPGYGAKGGTFMI
jgi:hypothetical protein